MSIYKTINKTSLLLKKLGKLPQKPGVYIYKDKNGKILYVGKAKKLKNRVKNYFEFDTQGRGRKFSASKKKMKPAKDLTPQKKLLVSKIKDIDYTVTDSEKEALLLETVLIKKHTPPYNIVMRDDKSYKYIKIDLDADWPTIYTVRHQAIKGRTKSKYFGPFTSSKNVAETIKLIKYIFPYCSRPPQKNRRPSPCFQYQIGRCLGVCTGELSRTRYLDIMNNIADFLKGNFVSVIMRLENEMKQASKEKRFELAAKTRDQIRAVKEIMEKQKVIAQKKDNQDYLSITRSGKLAAVNVFVVRSGRLIDKRNYVLDNTKDAPPEEILAAFIEQYYIDSEDLPIEIITQKDLSRFDIKVKGIQKIMHAQKGTKLKMLKLGEENAKEFLIARSASFERDEVKARLALEELSRAIGLESLPKRVEIYDMSNIQGAMAVGAMVVFVDGLPKKSEYRKFTIKNEQRLDDTHMMAEVISRRFSHSRGRKFSAPTEGNEWSTPDIIILDGGKGQLSVVSEILNQLKITIPVIALAKQEEEIFTPQEPRSIKLPKDSEALHLVQRMRDETHRFAISFYRSKHRKVVKKSVLDTIPGIGSATKKKLIKEFGSVAGIKKASGENIEKVVGEKVAAVLVENL